MISRPHPPSRYLLRLSALYGMRPYVNSCCDVTAGCRQEARSLPPMTVHGKKEESSGAAAVRQLIEVLLPSPRRDHYASCCQSGPGLRAPIAMQQSSHHTGILVSLAPMRWSCEATRIHHDARRRGGTWPLRRARSSRTLPDRSPRYRGSDRYPSATASQLGRIRARATRGRIRGGTEHRIRAPIRARPA